MKSLPIVTALTLAFSLGTATAQSQPGQSPSAQPQAAQTQQTSNRPNQAVSSKEAVTRMIQDWPKTSKFSAMQTLDKYGPPAEATPTRLVWFNNGPWQRTIVLKEPTEHNFPLPHKDVMEQAVKYKVPAEKVSELARFDGSVYVDITRGEMSARCDMEAANMIALNLAHEIITGKRTAEEAREFYPKAVMAFMQGESSPPAEYAKKLLFPQQQDTAFADKVTVSQEMVQKAEKIKQQKMQKEFAESDGGAAGRTTSATGGGNSK